MSLTTASYYSTPDVNVPQGTYNTLTATIARYERDYLIKVLGYELAKLVMAYVNPGSLTRIIDLVEGKEYTVGDYTVKWNGLLNTDLVSPLAFYVQLQWIKDNFLSIQNIGTVQSNTENGAVVSPAHIIQQSSIKLRELTGYAWQDALAPSLYNFLVNHQSDYSEWVFNEMGFENSFDL